MAFVFVERFWRSFLRAFPYIIPVVLHFGRYYARRLLALRKSWPKEWATSKNEEIAVTQDVDNTQALAPVCRGGGCDGFDTPLKDKKRHDDEMFLLRTCSTRRSDFEEDLLRSCEAHTASCQSKATTGRESIASATSVEERTRKKTHVGYVRFVRRRYRSMSGRKHLDITCRHLKRRHFPVFHNAMLENQKRRRRGAGLGMVGFMQPVPFNEVLPNSSWEKDKKE